MKNLTIKVKLFLILLSLLAPLLFVVYQLNLKVDEALNFSEKQNKGVVYEIPLLHLMDEVADYQTTLLARDAGDEAAVKDARDAETTIDGIFSELEEIDNKYGVDLEFTEEGLKDHGAAGYSFSELKRLWSEVKSSSQPSAEQFLKLQDHFSRMIKHLGDTSGMILDPDLDTYYLVDAALAVFPANLSKIAEVKAKTFVLLRDNNNKLPKADRSDYALLAINIKEVYAKRANDSIITAFNEDDKFNGVNPTLKPKLEPELATYNEGASKLSEALEKLADGKKMRGEKFLEIADVMHDGTAGLGAVALTELHKMIEIRIEGLKEQKHTLFAVVIGSIVFSIILFFFIARNISKSVNSLQSSISDVANGKNINVPLQDARDEFGDIARIVNGFKAEIVNNVRLKLALDSASSNVMIADDKLDIVYLNPSVEKFLLDAEKDIQKDLPNFKVEGLSGKNIDIFHKNPAHQRGMLAKLSSTYKTSIMVGGRSFDLIANPIFDKNSERVGTMVEWLDGMSAAIVNAVDTTQAMIEFEMDGTIVKANNNFSSVIGYNLDEIRGKHHRIFCTKEHAESPEYKEFWNKLRNGESQQGDFLRISKSGSEVWINAAYIPIKDLKGNYIKVVKIASDITRSKTSILENERGIEESVKILENLSNGDLTQRMTGDYKGTFQKIKASVNETIDKLNQIAGEIGESSNSVANSAAEISSASADLSKRTETQASTLEETAASMEEITATVKSNSKNSKEANIFATEAKAVAQEGGDVVKRVVGAMERITTSSTKISDIISVIDEIAFQTNLLALNAAVEAARAGDAGKGFAVVADEVRALAGRSSQASKQIKELINQSADQVKDGSVLVEKAGVTLDRVVDSFNKLAGLISEITVAGEEQSQGINEINTAISQMDAATQENAAMVEESTASAQSLSELANNLTELVSFFKLANDNEPMAARKPMKKIDSKPAEKVSHSVPKSKKAVAALDKKLSEGWEEF